MVAWDWTLYKNTQQHPESRCTRVSSILSRIQRDFVPEGSRRWRENRTRRKEGRKRAQSSTHGMISVDLFDRLDIRLEHLVDPLKIEEGPLEENVPFLCGLMALGGGRGGGGGSAELGKGKRSFSFLGSDGVVVLSSWGSARSGCCWGR